jgi:hypothetical protein
MLMRKGVLIATVMVGLAAPGSAQAQVLSTLTGAVIGGLAGAVYVSGMPATIASVGAAAGATASAVGSSVPVAAGAVAGMVAAASAPIVVGIIAGGAVGYMLAR